MSTGVLGKYKWKLKEDQCILTPDSQLDGTTFRTICPNMSERGRESDALALMQEKRNEVD